MNLMQIHCIINSKSSFFLIRRTIPPLKGDVFHERPLTVDERKEFVGCMMLMASTICLKTKQKNVEQHATTTEVKYKKTEIRMCIIIHTTMRSCNKRE